MHDYELCIKTIIWSKYTHTHNNDFFFKKNTRDHQTTLVLFKRVMFT